MINNPIIIDTDLGDDIDDMWAIGFAKLAGFDIRLITVSFTDIEYKLKCARYMADILKLKDCAISGGVEKAKGPTPHIGRVDNVFSGAGNLPAEDEIARVVSQNEFVDIYAIGPMTNIGAFVTKYPYLKNRCRILCMGGCVNKGIFRVDKAHSEYNLKSDINASIAVLASGFDVVYAPLDCNRDFIFDGERYQAIRKSKNEITQKLVELYDEWQVNYNGLSLKFDSSVSSSVQYDITPFLFALYPELFEASRARYGLDMNGKLFESENGYQTTVLTGINKQKLLDKTLVFFM